MKIRQGLFAGAKIGFIWIPDAVYHKFQIPGSGIFYKVLNGFARST